MRSIRSFYKPCALPRVMRVYHGFQETVETEVLASGTLYREQENGNTIFLSENTLYFQEQEDIQDLLDKGFFKLEHEYDMEISFTDENGYKVAHVKEYYINGNDYDENGNLIREGE